MIVAETGKQRLFGFTVLILSFAFLIFSAAGASAEIPPEAQLKVKSEGGYSALLAKADRKGSVRVIITLNEPFLVADAGAGFQTTGIAKAQAEFTQSLGSSDITHVTNFKYAPHVAAKVGRSALAALVSSPSVSSVVEDVPDTYSLNLSVPRIGVPEIEDLGYTGAGFAVVILDTGVDKGHTFLNGAVVSEACYSKNDSEDFITSLCPGGVTESITAGSALPYAGSCPPGGCDHGTHVAGIATGRANSLVSGVARQADLIAIQVFSRFDKDEDCGGNAPCVRSFQSDQMKALERVLELSATYNIAAVNMSLGGGLYASYCDDDPRKAYIDSLRAANIATIIASGNSASKGKISAPACISSAISVGATTDADTVASYSNSAPILKLLAPGSNILSSVPGGGYSSWYGTSMAAPHVAGAWALVRQAVPDVSVQELLALFKVKGVPVTDTNGIIKARIKLNKALPIKLLSPNGGDVLIPGASQLIQWQAAANAAFFKLKYSLDNGQTWLPMPPSTVNGTSYQWSVPPLAGNKKKCLVKIIGLNTNSDIVGSDVSDVPFAIEVVKLNSPDGGDLLTSGIAHTVTWTNNQTIRDVAKVSLMFTTDGGTTWKAGGSVTGNPGQMSWTPVVGATKMKCKVKIILKDNAGNSLGSDESDEFFVINQSS